jgi:NADH-quinone oxidoreductase subunit M
VTEYLLNLILWIPFLGMILLLFLPKENKNAVRWTALITSAITFIFTLVLYQNFDLADPNIQMSIKVPWIKYFNVFYTLGVDGISLPMVILTGLLFMLCMISSWSVEKYVKSYYFLLLMLEGSVMGVFLSLDFVLFYVFWEVMLLPMFFLIGIWGSKEREYAAIKFFLYTFFGSIIMLVGIIGLYYASGKGVDSFSIIQMHGGKFSTETITLFGKQFSFENLVFWAMFIGFAIKVPVFPFHTWLPHAHVQAPTGVSVILAGVLLKMGSYGFLRISFPIFPKAANLYADSIAVLGLVSVLYGAFCAMAQNNVKRLVAYSSISHMGFVMMGMAAMTTAGMNGAVLQMFNHGCSAAMMFLMVGMLYERSHHLWIERDDGSLGYGGLYTQMPIYSIIFIISMFAALGLPGLSGFISEALIFIGIFPVFKTYTVLAVIGLLIGAAYLLYMFKRMFFGEVNKDCEKYTDMNTREIIYMVPLCIAVVVFGIYPTPILDMMKASVGLLVEILKNAA